MLMSNLCAYCNDSFERKTHNQKYCDEECCRKATNERIMRRYYEKRDNRKGKERMCSHKDCTTRLSRYNEETVCAIHAKKVSPQREELLRTLRGL
jgi:uncharacterized protein (UPF0371 family)